MSESARDVLDRATWVNDRPPNMADIIIAALDAAGFAILPKVLTATMVAAAERVLVADEDGELSVTTFDESETRALYAAVLEAMPKP